MLYVYAKCLTFMQTFRLALEYSDVSQIETKEKKNNKQNHIN